MHDPAPLYVCLLMRVGVMQRPDWDPKTGKPVFTPYLDHYPFHFYSVLRDVESLPTLLADALRQWYEITLEG